MKMRRLIAGLILIIVISLLMGCIDGRPPEYSVGNPYAILDKTGGVIVAYQVNTGNEAKTYIQRFSANGDWGKQGIELGAGSGSFTSSLIDFASLVTDKYGNVTVIYSLGDNVWARKLDMAGNPVWEGETTKRISPTDLPTPAYFKAIGNDADETIIAWSGSRDHLTIMKGDGFNTSYVTSVSTPNLDKFDLASDASGNVYVSWKDNPNYSEGNIYVQKVDSNGQVAWQSEGILLSDVHSPAYISGAFDSQIVSDGDGGAIAIWVHLAEGEKSDGLNLYAQRIGANGEFLWEEAGVPIGDKTSLQRSQFEPCVISDGSGGVIIFWEHGVKTIWAQRLDSRGNPLWAESGIEIVQATGSDVIYYDAVGDGSGGAGLVWNDNRILRAQNLDADGKKLWEDEGVKVSNIPAYWAAYATPARISPDGTGGFYISWAAGKNIKDKTSSYIQKILTNGGLLWGEDGVRLNK